MLKSLRLLTLILFSLTLFISCEDTITDPEEGSNFLTVTHLGVDWSEGKASTETDFVNDPDGETVGWCPNGDGSGWGEGVWYRSVKNNLYRVGPGNLSDVTSVDTSKWSRDVCSTPLANGDVWVAEAADGYVAFKVLDAPMDSAAIADDPLWSVEVEYKFSTTLGF